MDERERQQRDIDTRKAAVDAYTNTCERLEKDIAMIDAGAFYASAAISLKRIADALDAQRPVKVTGDELRAVMANFIRCTRPDDAASIMLSSGYYIGRKP